MLAFTNVGQKALVANLAPRSVTDKLSIQDESFLYDMKVRQSNYARRESRPNKGLTLRPEDSGLAQHSAFLALMYKSQMKDSNLFGGLMKELNIPVVALDRDAASLHSAAIAAAQAAVITKSQEIGMRKKLDSLPSKLSKVQVSMGFGELTVDLVGNMKMENGMTALNTSKGHIDLSKRAAAGAASLLQSGFDPALTLYVAHGSTKHTAGKRPAYALQMEGSMSGSLVTNLLGVVNNVGWDENWKEIPMHTLKLVENGNAATLIRKKILDVNEWTADCYDGLMKYQSVKRQVPIFQISGNHNFQSDWDKALGLTPLMTQDAGHLFRRMAVDESQAFHNNLTMATCLQLIGSYQVQIMSRKRSGEQVVNYFNDATGTSYLRDVPTEVAKKRQDFFLGQLAKCSVEHNRLSDKSFDTILSEASKLSMKIFHTMNGGVNVSAVQQEMERFKERMTIGDIIPEGFRGKLFRDREEEKQVGDGVGAEVERVEKRINRLQSGIPKLNKKDREREEREREEAERD